MKTFTVTKSNFLNWYFNTGDDKSQVDEATKIGDTVIKELKHSGKCIFTVKYIWDICEKNCIPLKYTEEFNPKIHNENEELGDLKDGYKIKLIK